MNKTIKLMLDLFGIPWLNSPTEAEAQCSYLEEKGIVDGTISDDSDCFLFGSRRVYTNFFKKGMSEILETSMKSVEIKLGLGKQQLIFLALFLGCDYHDGVRGIGLVNGLEVINCFRDLEGLERFKLWAEKPDNWLEAENIYSTALGKTEVKLRKISRRVQIYDVS